jgi:AcrR family transcriptional regulator
MQSSGSVSKLETRIEEGVDAGANSSLGLRDKRIAEARERIVRTAFEAFERSGFDATSVDALAAAAGVSRRTFFRYFATKDDVVLERRRDQLAQLSELLEKAPREEEAGALVARALSRLADDYRARRSQVLRERALFAATPALALRDRELDDQAESVLSTAVARRIEGPDRQLRARLYAAAVMGIARVALDDWAARAGRGPIGSESTELLQLLEPFISTAARPRRARSRP